MTYFSKTGHEESYGVWWREQNANRDTTQIVLADIPLTIGPDVFSPDTDTTHSVQFLIDTFPDVSNKRVLDIGTGSGILAILAAKRMAKQVIGTEILAPALDNAVLNVQANNVSDRVVF